MCCVQALHGVPNRHEAINANQHHYVGAQVEACHLQELEDLALDVAQEPGDAVAPNGVAANAENGDQQVGDGQMKDQLINRGRRVRTVPSFLGDRIDRCAVGQYFSKKFDMNYKNFISIINLECFFLLSLPLTIAMTPSTIDLT